MAELKVIRAQHQDHKREWRLRLDPLGQALNAIATWFERIFPDRPPSVQAVFHDSDGLAKIIQFLFKNARPAFLKRKPSSSVRNDSPCQRVGVNENVEHVAILTGRLVAGDWLLVENDLSLRPRCGQVELLTDTRKHAGIRDSAGVAFVDSCTQRGKFRLMLLFFALQRAQYFRTRFHSARSQPWLSQGSSGQIHVSRGNPQHNMVSKA